MIVVLWITLFVVVVGIILYAGERSWRRKNKSQNSDLNNEKHSGAEMQSNDANQLQESETDSDECCGLHLVCEKDSLSPMSADIIYYDDEELDRFIGRTAESYTPEETEEFRDILMTLLPEDIAGWARSITQRRLELPPEIRDELLMIINEQRSAK